MTARLRAAPSTLPALVAVVVMAWWAFDGGGFAVGKWAPGGLVLVGLLAGALAAIPPDWRRVPRAVLVALAAFAGFALWSLASIAWADDPGFALQGASRTLVYLVVFALFALWPQREATAAWVLGALVAVVGAVAVVTLVRLTGDASAPALLGSGRLKAPTGYPNATAALLMMGLLATVVLFASDRVAWWLRGLLAAVAVAEAALALLTVSRGAVYSTPIVLLALFVLLPGRVRHLFALAPIAAAVAVCGRRLLDVGDVANAKGDITAAAHRGLGPVVASAVAAGLVVAVVAALQERRERRPELARRAELGARAVAVAVLVAAVAGGIAVAGNPRDRVDSAWSSFKGGYQANDVNRNRLVAGLGSNRYDFYRVALDTFSAHPVAGVGADGFFQQYLREGRSGETPRYPHSLELRALAQTGIVGALLLLVTLVAALAAAVRAAWAGRGLGAVVAGAAAMGSVYWLVHGSLDWFWEWAGLGAPAFALLGLAGALVPRREASAAAAARRAASAVPAVAVALLALPLASLWVSDRAQRRAAQHFATEPQAAYRLLDQAAAIDPFSSAPATLEGSIALRLGDLPRADAAFGRALGRVPDDAYATLERGALASARGDRARAPALLSRAVALAPRDPLAREALQIVRSGGAVDTAELNRRILSGAQQLGA